MMRDLILAAVLVVGCGGGGTADTTEPITPTPEPTPTQTPAPDTTVDNAPVADVEAPPVDYDASNFHINTGVTECDVPYNRYINCLVDKMPKGAPLDATLEGMKMTADAFYESAKTDEGRKGLVETCEIAAEAYETAADALGCTG